MANSDTVSVTSSTLSTELDDVAVVSEEQALGGDTDRELQAALGRLDTNLTPDADVSLNAPDTDSIGAASSSSSLRDPDHPNAPSSDSDDASATTGVDPKDGAGSQSQTEMQEKPSTCDKGKGTQSKQDSVKKRKNPLRLLKKLTKFDKPKKKEKLSEFELVRIDKLPQVFVAKYLGMREVHGFCGLHHVRKPVDEMVSRVQKNLEKQEQVELPLVYVIVSPKGLDVREHKLNKQKEGMPAGMVPIDFISYGVQDIKYWRVFTFIVVRELSSRSKTTECHAYLCDSSLNARKMALSLGASFRLYSRGLKKEGKVHNFQVELRPPDELVEALTEDDCDA